MKILITENKLLGGIKSMIKKLGTQSAIDFVGGWESFCQVLKIESPMDFLHLFDDLDVVQSEEEKNWTLFRYKKGDNLMVYNRENGQVYISYHELWSFLEYKFGLKYSVIQGLTKKWLGEDYNLRGITTIKRINILMQELGEDYNLRGITTAGAGSIFAGELGEDYNLRGITTVEEIIGRELFVI